MNPWSKYYNLRIIEWDIQGETIHIKFEHMSGTVRYNQHPDACFMFKTPLAVGVLLEVKKSTYEGTSCTLFIIETDTGAIKTVVIANYLKNGEPVGDFTSEYRY